jgi:hypothetical protein
MFLYYKTFGQHLKDMQKVIKDYKIPENSIISDGFERIDYCDTYEVVTKTNDSIDKLTTKIFKIPDWVALLMKIRNTLVKLFGIKTGDTNDINESEYYPIGSKAVYFTVIDRNDKEIVMAEEDKHLNFRTSVLIRRKGSSEFVNLTTIVKYNNIWGRIYFMPVKPFHQIIIKSLMKRLIK